MNNEQFKKKTTTTKPTKQTKIERLVNFLNE